MRAFGEGLRSMDEKGQSKKTMDEEAGMKRPMDGEINYIRKSLIEEKKNE
jgi:hypothetical protein